MNLRRLTLRFLRSDPSYAPFGRSWLRGLTPARIAVVTALLTLFELQGLAVAVLQQGIGLLQALWELLYSLALRLVCVAPVLVLVTAADNLSARASAAARFACLVLALVAGAVVYAGLLFECDADCERLGLGARLFLSDFAWVLSWGGLMTGALFFLERERRTSAQAQQAALDGVDLDRQMAEARLQMLQAQIEPHFLFNSLATVQSLYHQDAAQGKRLLKDILAYLRGALPQMRETVSTLRREFTLCEAYLRVLQVRMGERLKVEIDLPAELRGASIPPMMLPTLIENAIKHGIAPLPQGGTVRIRAEARGPRLRVAVVDDGAGFRRASGGGIGLDNTRARLASLFGHEASLVVVANAGAGVTATLELPMALAAAAGATA